MKEAVVRASDSNKTKKGTIIRFNWGITQQSSFEAIKQLIEENIITGRNLPWRYYLSICSTTTEFSAVFFQLEEEDEERLDCIVLYCICCPY